MVSNNHITSKNVKNVSLKFLAVNRVEFHDLNKNKITYFDTLFYHVTAWDTTHVLRIRLGLRYYSK